MTRYGAAFVFVATCMAAPVATPSEPGTIGVQVSQIYIEQEGNHRGSLVIRSVSQKSGAAEAGLSPGDLILAVDGRDVEGHTRSESLAWLNGPAATDVRLTIASQDGKKNVTVHRKPYPPRVNPPQDPFQYQVPGYWTVDPRYTFPLTWAPGLKYMGFEDVGFSSGFDDTNSPEYHSYFFLWWLDHSVVFSSDALQKDLTAYYWGLSEQRGRNKDFTPEVSRVNVTLRPSPIKDHPIDGKYIQGFEGSFTVYDRRGQIIKLEAEIVSTSCGEVAGTEVLFFVSRLPRPSAFWNQLDAIRKSFACRVK